MDRTRLARAPPRSQVEMGIRRTIYVAMPEQFAHHFRATPAWAGRCEMMAMPSGRRTVTAGRLSRLPAPTRSTRPSTPASGPPGERSGSSHIRQLPRQMSHRVVRRVLVVPTLTRSVSPCPSHGHPRSTPFANASESATLPALRRSRPGDERHTSGVHWNGEPDWACRPPAW